MAKFKKVYVEISNICSLRCDFCPPPVREYSIMDTQLFEQINKELKSLTNDIAYHVLGDPLSLSNLKEYLDISLRYLLNVHITTAGNLLTSNRFDLLTHEAVKQVNFSLNSYNGNSFKISLDEYLKEIFEFCDFVLNSKKELFINLRVWNFDDTNSSKEFNTILLQKIFNHFDLNLDIEQIYQNRPKNIKVAKKIFINFGEYFKWPSLHDDTISESGNCYGLISHFAILSNGVVVPCCLDKDGVIELGNIHKSSLKEILNSKMALDIKYRFKHNKLYHKLCKKCSYRTRFDK